MATAAPEVSSQTSQAGPLGGCISRWPAGASTQLGGLVADGDALGAQLPRVGAVRIADDTRLRAGLQHLARQAAVLQPWWAKAAVGASASRVNSASSVRALIGVLLEASLWPRAHGVARSAGASV